MATTNGAKERFGELLKDCGLSQRGLAQLKPDNLPPDQSRISRAINGQIRLSQDERQRLVGTLHREGCLSRIEDLLWIGETLGMDENELARAAPPPAATTNLTLPDNRPYLAPTGLCTLRDQLTRVRAPGDLYHAWRVQEDLHRIQISAVSGPPGSGKTSLLEHLAADYTVRHTFPIILYANLAGETSALPVLHAWLAAFGEPPAGRGAAKSLLRHKIGRKRSLFLIDDLADARLLPDLLVGGERSRVVIVCSQNVATEAGIPREAMLAHGGWNGADACRYLESLWSRKLAGGERDWALEINELVNGLPLAWVLLAPLLDDPGGWEDVLAGLRVAPIGILNWSHNWLWNSFELAYQRLPRPAQALFQALGVLAPGAPFDAESAAAIRDVSLAEAKRGLAALNQASFLGAVPSVSSGGYRQMHRLLHHFALELIEEDPRREEYAERHAHFYAGRAHALRKEQNSPAWGKSVRRFLVDRPNVRQGQAWAAERGHRLTVDYFLNVAPYQVATRDREGHLAWGQAALSVVETSSLSIIN